MGKLLLAWVALAAIAEACAIVRRQMADAWNRRPWGRQGTRGPY